MKVAVIPARGGSKRIPRKNIRPFAGRPMIEYAISAAHESGLFDHIVTSTDDEEIAMIARRLGAETPFVRPPELSDDYATTAAVMAHAVGACEQLGWSLEWICCLYPAVPFIDVTDLSGALALLQQSTCDYALPVAEFPSAVQRALRRQPTGELQPIYPQYEISRTQDLEPAYHDAGQFYWGSRRAWLQNDRIHSHAVGYAIPSWRVVDIDTLDDWRRAELIHAALSRNANA